MNALAVSCPTCLGIFLIREPPDPDTPPPVACPYCCQTGDGFFVLDLPSDTTLDAAELEIAVLERDEPLDDPPPIDPADIY